MRQEGTIRPGKAVALAIEAGFSKNIVYKAREELAGRLAADRSKFDPETKWVWLGNRMPGKLLPES